MMVKNLFGLWKMFRRENDTAPDEQVIEVYYRALSDLSDEEFIRAIDRVVKIRVFPGMPKPAEIRDAAGGGESEALLALDKAEKAVELHGMYKAVIFDDPVIHMVVSAMGGWTKFCRPDAFGEYQQPHWQRKEFVSLYETFSKNPRAECPKVLIGSGDTSYQRGDELVLVPPVIVGDKVKALSWTKSRDHPQLEAPDGKDFISVMAGKFKIS